MEPIVHTIETHIFPLRVYFSRNSGMFTSANFISLADRHVISIDCEDGVVFGDIVKCVETGKNGVLVIVPEDAEIHGVLHEIVHVVDKIFAYIGEDVPGVETRAYLTEYLYKEIIKIITNS